MNCGGNQVKFFQSEHHHCLVFCFGPENISWFESGFSEKILYDFGDNLGVVYHQNFLS